MNLEYLRQFLRVAELGSLTKAAAVLGIVQPVISRNIANLEHELGGRLFNRTGRGVELSALGERLLPQARDLIVNSERFVDDARAFSNAPSGTVSIGMPASFATMLIPLLFDHVRDQLPEVRLKVFTGTIGRTDKLLEEGRIDISLNFDDAKAMPGDAIHITDVDTYLVGKPDDPLLRNPTVPFVALDGLPLILSATPSGLRLMLDELATEHKIHLDPVAEADSFPLHLRLASAGIGYALLTPQAVRENLDGYAMGISRIVSPSIVRSIYLGTSMRFPPTLATRRVVELLHGIIQDMIAARQWQQMPDIDGETE